MYYPDINCTVPRRSYEPGTLPYFFASYILPFVIVFGIVGNALNVVILKRRKSNANFILLLIAVADLCFYVPVCLSRIIAYDTLAISEDFVRIHVYANIPLVSMANWFSSVSIWLALLITFERLIAIRMPLKVHTFWNRKKLTFVVVTICVTAALLRIPDHFWYFVLVRPNCHDGRQTVYQERTITQLSNYYHVLQTLQLLSFVFVDIVPLILLVIFNCLVLYFLRRSATLIATMGTCSNNRQSQTERTVTKRVFFVVVTFFVLNFPSTVIGTWSMFTKNETLYLILIDVPASVADLLVILSKAVNFPLYCVINPDFRKQLGKMFDNCRNWPCVMNVQMRKTVNHATCGLCCRDGAYMQTMDTVGESLYSNT